MKIRVTTWRLVGDALQLGVSIVAAVFIGAFIGYMLDGWLGTFPYLSIIFFCFGVAAAARNVITEVRKQLRADLGNDKAAERGKHKRPGSGKEEDEEEDEDEDSW